MAALIQAFQQIRLSGEFVTQSGQRLQVGSDNTLMVRDSGNFSSAANLTQTGATLVALNLSTSGALAAQISANAAGVGSLNGLSGSLSLSSASPGVSFVTSGTNTIFLTGAASTALVTGLSGQIVTDFATKVQLTNTGVTLTSNIVGLSGATNTLVIASGASAITHADSVGVTISGNLTQTGAVLGSKIDALSGFYTGSFLSYITGLSTGSDSVYINHLNYVFPSIPKVTFTLELTTSNIFYSSAVSGRSTSGFYAIFSDILAETGLLLDVFARI